MTVRERPNTRGTPYQARAGHPFITRRDEIKGKTIQRLGVGAGLATTYPRAISRDYIGADYSREMIHLCRKTFGEGYLTGP